MTLLLGSCEAQVLDPAGNSIKNSGPSVDTQAAEENKIITIRNLNVKGVIPYIDMVTRMLPKNVNAAKNVRKIAVKEKRKIVSARTVAAKKRKPATNEYWPVACFYQEQRKSVGPSLFS